MAIHQTHRQTDLEKRLKILRRQFYGRESVASSKQYVVREANLPFGGPLPTTDVSYLKADLLKIFIFSSVALGAQIILYFLIRNHILSFKLF